MGKKILKKLKWYDLKKILIRYTVFIVPVIALFFFIYQTNYSNHVNTMIDLVVAEQKQGAIVTDYFIKDVFADLQSDLFVVRNSSEVRDYINNPSADKLENTEKLFLRIATNKSNFDQIRYINEQGMEVVRVNNIDNDPYLVPSSDLQDKSDRYYYLEASELKNGELFLSDMDLNVEAGDIEVPYKPMIRVATPLYSSSNEFKGVLIINYLGKDLLDFFYEQFDNTEYNFIEPALLNDQGYYLYNKDHDKTFGFMLTDRKDYSLLHEDTDFWNKIITNNSGSMQLGSRVAFYIKSSQQSIFLHIHIKITHGLYYPVSPSMIFLLSRIACSSA